jgi:hypothetical protein
MILRKISTASALALVFAALLACGSLPGTGPLSVGGPTPGYSPVPVSTEAIQSLANKLDSLGATSGEVTISITESELTSIVEQQMAAQPNSAFSKPQVYLRDGKIKLYATVTTNNLQANALIVFNAVLQDNHLQVAIDTADFGPVPVPQTVLDSLTSTINNQLAPLGSRLPTGVALKDIAIADGQLTMTALVK